jgi:LPXTG-motif cell wall-anchored protein
MRHIPMRRLVAVLALALFAVLAPSTAAFAQYSNVPTLTINTPTTTPCSQVVIKGTGFLPNHEVTITADGVVVGTVMSDANGDFTFTYTVPCNAVDGEIEFKANDGTNVLTVKVNVVVSGTSATPAPTGTLPKTGSSNTQNLLRIGVLLIAVGGMVVIATRRRSSRSRA